MLSFLLLPRILLLIPGILFHPAFARNDGTCSAWMSGLVVGQVENSEILEASGLAASHIHEDTFWIVNDSDGGDYIYAVNSDGDDLGAWELDKADNEDWEDIAIGPCGAEFRTCSCIYVADSGDNDLVRGGGVVWRAPEPDIAEGGGQTENAEALSFLFPDGSHDTETILVDPNTGQVFLVTKDDNHPGVYSFPDAPPEPSVDGNPVMLTKVAEVDLEDMDVTRGISGGAISPGGMRVVLRTDMDLLLFVPAAGESLISALATEGVRLPAPEQGFGEAVTFTPDGLSLFLVGEGKHTEMWELECRSFTSEVLDTADPLVECKGSHCGCSSGARWKCSLMGALVSGMILLRRRRTVPSRVAGPEDKKPRHL